MEEEGSTAPLQIQTVDVTLSEMCHFCICSFVLTLSPRPNTQPPSMRNATCLLWILKGMAPPKLFVAGKGRGQSERPRHCHPFTRRTCTLIQSHPLRVLSSQSLGWTSSVDFEGTVPLALVENSTTVPSAPTSAVWGSCSDLPSGQVASTAGDTCKVNCLAWAVEQNHYIPPLLKF